jgi:thiol-disulfide isomerase/thioredoxin
MKIKLLFFVLLIVTSCNKNKKETVADVILENENAPIEFKDFDLEIYDFNDFEKFLRMDDDKVYVINFWATWCKPCIKELPYFEQLNKKYSNKNVEVILVSLDFPHLYDTKLKPFIVKNQLASKVIVLDDVDMDTWIPKVSETWSGSIPATIIYKNDESEFYERSFSFKELETEVKQFLN